jgi:hypothetical protein
MNDFAPLRAELAAMTDDQLRLVGRECVDVMRERYLRDRSARRVLLQLCRQEWQKRHPRGS